MGEVALPIALAFSTAATLGTTVYQMSAAEEAKQAAENAAKEQTAATNRALAEKAAEDRTMEAKEVQAAQNVKDRSAQKAKQAMHSGRRGTILTSPLGIPGNVQTGEKTLLGV